MVDGKFITLRISLSCVAAITWCLPLETTAAEPDPRLTITELRNVDHDFAYMGEFHGKLNDKVGAGLQIVALGNGKFRGMFYDGGLPGTGWDKEGREVLEGERAGDLLELKGATKRIELVNTAPTVYDSDGKILGALRKVERMSPTLGMQAPSNARVLFDGSNTDAFKNGKITPEGLLQEGTELVDTYQDFTLHAEFLLPYMPFARGQGRSNSGFYLLSSYEVQVLDSFGLEGIENECGALYRYRRPAQNMCLPPLQWQTYDITFRSPKFDAEGKKIQNARITVLHNGVAVHDNFEVERKTGAGQPESNKPRPIKLQDHSNPVRFRNIWIVDLARPRGQFASRNW